jgi:hypothetical protein
LLRGADGAPGRRRDRTNIPFREAARRARTVVGAMRLGLASPVTVPSAEPCAHARLRVAHRDLLSQAKSAVQTIRHEMRWRLARGTRPGMTALGIAVVQALRSWRRGLGDLRARIRFPWRIEAFWVRFVHNRSFVILSGAKLEPMVHLPPLAGRLGCIANGLGLAGAGRAAGHQRPPVAAPGNTAGGKVQRVGGVSVLANQESVT